MKKKLNTVPVFASEDEERLYWGQHDATDYLDWGKAQKVVMPNLKPTTKTISLRLSQHLLDSINLLPIPGMYLTNRLLRSGYRKTARTLNIAVDEKRQQFSYVGRRPNRYLTHGY